jgi:thiamine pyrophosphokinase
VIVLYHGVMTDFEGALLVANAPLRWSSQLAAKAAAARPLLAADGGANHLSRLGLRPTAVVGDLDSISAETRTWLGEDCMVHQPDQDRTDLDKALEYAFDVAGVTHLTVLAALGGRIDHDLGNLGLLVRLAMGERLVFEDVDQRVLAVAGEISLQAHPGETWSFWTFDPTVHVTIEGVRWPVAGAALDVSRRPSISNEATTDEIRIRATGGAVVVTRHHR